MAGNLVKWIPRFCNCPHMNFLPVHGCPAPGYPENRSSRKAPLPYGFPSEQAEQTAVLKSVQRKLKTGKNPATGNSVWHLKANTPLTGFFSQKLAESKTRLFSLSGPGTSLLPAQQMLLNEQLMQCFQVYTGESIQKQHLRQRFRVL